MNNHNHLVFNRNHKYNKHMGGSIKKRSSYLVLTSKHQEAVDKRFQINNFIAFLEG